MLCDASWVVLSRSYVARCRTTDSSCMHQCKRGPTAACTRVLACVGQQLLHACKQGPSGMRGCVPTTMHRPCMLRIHRPMLRATVDLRVAYNQQTAVLHLMGAVASSISSEPWNFYLMHQIKRTYVDTLRGRRFGVPSYL